MTRKTHSMKFSDCPYLAVFFVVASSFAATVEQNGQMARDLVMGPVREYREQEEKRLALLLKIAMANREEQLKRDLANQVERSEDARWTAQGAREERDLQTRRDMLAAEHRFQLEMDKRREERSRAERQVAAPSALVTASKSTPRKTKPLPLEDIIPFEEHEASGLNKLSNAERDYLAKLLIEKLAAAYQAARIAAPNPARLSSPTAPTVYSAVGKGHWIKTNIDSGTFIQLEDESLWEIDPPGQIDASLWLPTASIVVVESNKGSPRYGYRLINTDDGESAHARLIAAP